MYFDSKFQGMDVILSLSSSHCVIIRSGIIIFNIKFPQSTISENSLSVQGVNILHDVRINLANNSA